MSCFVYMSCIHQLFTAIWMFMIRLLLDHIRIVFQRFPLGPLDKTFSSNSHIRFQIFFVSNSFYSVCQNDLKEGQEVLCGCSDLGSEFVDSRIVKFEKCF